MKKKGLIISTVVMAVVLIASLTTATYAWFSATSSATVSNLSVTTQAAKGLEIAVKETNNASVLPSGYANGTLGFADGKFSGTDGWGTTVDFSAITDTTTGTLGVWDQAVTLVVTGDKDLADASLTGKVYREISSSEIASYQTSGYYNATAVSDGIKYAKDVDGTITMTVVDTTTSAEETGYKTLTYATTAATDKYIPGDYVIPIGYNKSGNTLVPYGYLLASKNIDYMNLPISIRATSDVAAILCTIKITPDDGTIADWANYKPGMAAATYIDIKDSTGNVVRLEPYSDITTLATKLSSPTDTAFEFKFVVAYNNGKDVTAADAIDYTYTVWIEGTDGQCINATAGSSYSLAIDYDYIEGGQSLTIDTTGGNLTTDANGTIAMETVAYTKTITYESKSYYVLNITKGYTASV